MASILLLGASGLVGGESLRIAVDYHDIGRVVAPTRRPLPAHPKLLNPVPPTLKSLIPEVAAWAIEAGICALGTTRKKAGSDQALRHVDYELPLSFARAARHAGAAALAVVTSIGASRWSRLFYGRTKGELERDLQTVGFPSLTILRPMFLDGECAELRRGEAAVVAMAKAFELLLPRSLHVSPASTVAHRLVDAVIQPRAGVRVISSRELAGTYDGNETLTTRRVRNRNEGT
jgi:uncharacterized protein YbjT (DUF2867 family)